MKKPICLLLFLCGSLHAVFSQKKLGMLEFLYNATVRIQTVDSVVKKDGKNISYGTNGTGFFFVFKTGRGDVPSIVTSRTIINSAESINFFFLEADKTGNPIYGKQQMVTLKRSALPIFYHPDNSVDLAIIPINPIMDYLQKQNITISFHSLDETVIPTDTMNNTFNPTEDLYMIGHPAGLKNELNSLPVFSRGITSTPVFLDHYGRKEFLAELNVYEGSTGALVMFFQSNNNTRYDEPMVGQRILLGGILSGTYSKGFRSRVVLKGSYPSEEMIQHENTGIIIKSQRLLDFKKLLNGLKK
ncbi:MAG: hypothetical protein V4539_19085 [Bacteroidota bacterium]